MTTTRIRFVGRPGEAYYYLKLGPIHNPNPPERVFQGGEASSVRMQPTSGTPDCVDLTFDDGEFAIEVPREFFDVIDENIEK